MPFELAALGAALCWTVTGIISTSAARHLGGIAFTRIRMLIIFVMMLAWVIPAGTLSSIPADQWSLLLFSGLIGIFLGDTALFTAMSRMGPRRTGILFATNAPMTVVIAWLWFGESLSFEEVAGCLAVAVGVSLAILFGRGRTNQHALEEVQGRLWVGVMLGLFAALCQAVGALMSKPALQMGADPVAVTTIRVGIAALALQVSNLLPIAAQRQRNPLNAAVLGRCITTGVLGMALAMSLLMYAYANGNAGIAATLSSTTPVLVLPLIWLITRQAPHPGAWFGALVCVAGTALILV